MIISFLFGIALIFIEKSLSLGTTNSASSSYLYLILSGFLMSVGIVVPGISNTVVLMCLGVYTTYIDAVATINFHILVPMGIGLFFGCLLWIRIIKYLFDKYHQATSYRIHYRFCFRAISRFCAWHCWINLLSYIFC